MIIDGKKIAEDIKRTLLKKITTLKKRGIQPGLGIVLVGDDPGSVMYIGMKQRMAQTLGFYVKKIHLSQQTSTAGVVEAVEALNTDEHIHGIIVQLPLPPQVSSEQVAAALNLAKDIDCFQAHSPLLPPTAEAVVRCLRAARAKVAGARAVVMGAGFFGRQIAAHLLNAGAVVSTIDATTKNRNEILKTSKIIVTAVGKANVLQGDMVSDRCIVIDLGANRVKGKVVGDAHFASVAKKARAITPVPGGVGPVTVILLMENVVTATRQSLTKHL